MSNEIELPVADRDLGIRGLAEAKEIIRHSYLNGDIILFGSWARGEQKKESDIDLCILLDHAERRVIDIAADFHRALSDILKQSLDLVVFEREVFEERERAGASFERSIMAEGISI